MPRKRETIILTIEKPENISSEKEEKTIEWKVPTQDVRKIIFKRKVKFIFLHFMKLKFKKLVPLE